MFCNFLVCMELLLILQGLLASPNLNALPVHYAKQVPPASFFLFFFTLFFFLVLEGLRRVSDDF